MVGLFAGLTQALDEPIFDGDQGYYSGRAAAPSVPFDWDPKESEMTSHNRNADIEV